MASAEGDHQERQGVKTSQQLNQELKGVFQLLPDFNIFYAEEGTHIQDSSGKIINRRSAHEQRKDLDNLQDQLERRGRSQMRPILKERLQALLERSYLTPSACIFLTWEFDEMTVDGIEREDYPPELPFPTEVQYYSSLFQWDKPESGGIFDPLTAQEIDRRLYKRAVNGIFSRQRMEKELEEGEDFTESQRLARDLGSETRDRVKKMTSEELEAYEKSKTEEDAYATEIMQRWKDEEELVRVWRRKYSLKYSDEP